MPDAQLQRLAQVVGVDRRVIGMVAPHGTGTDAQTIAARMRDTLSSEGPRIGRTGFGKLAVADVQIGATLSPDAIAYRTRIVFFTIEITGIKNPPLGLGPGGIPHHGHVQVAHCGIEVLLQMLLRERLSLREVIETMEPLLGRKGACQIGGLSIDPQQIREGVKILPSGQSTCPRQGGSGL